MGKMVLQSALSGGVACVRVVSLPVMNRYQVAEILCRSYPDDRHPRMNPQMFVVQSRPGEQQPSVLLLRFETQCYCPR
uniref:Putative secreted protein n=1 Tax=Anopheles darlingi TaxID=43151 RepID=A0A2M4DF74_ANODA